MHTTCNLHRSDPMLYIPSAAVSHHGPVMALWENVLDRHIPGIFASSPLYLHPSQANTIVDEHSIEPS